MDNDETKKSPPKGVDKFDNLTYFDYANYLRQIKGKGQ